MALDKPQLQSLIERTLAMYPPLNSPSAVQLILGTIAQESRFGTYLRQLGKGPARGICQMERATFDDLQERFGQRFPEIVRFTFEQLEWDLRASILLCRIKYWSIVGNLPTEDDLVAQASFWKRFYNTPLGAGKVQEYIENYRRFVV